MCVIVYATMRNLGKAELLVEAADRTLGRTLEIRQLDVCSEESIKACVDSLPERRVDILSKPAHTPAHTPDATNTHTFKASLILCTHFSLWKH